MRIISGSLKGKKLNFIKSTTTRPLRDYVKENIFNILSHSNLLLNLTKDTAVLDLYSGIGSFGIECISRGAKEATFIEKDFTAEKILRNNLKELGIENKTTVINENISSYLPKIKKKFNIFFFDPPYADNSYTENIEKIKKLSLYEKNHLIIVHREKKTDDGLEKILNIMFIKNYGRSNVIFGVLN
jgi:16S rRNA (guanine966-N2)-methyltransferase